MKRGRLITFQLLCTEVETYIQSIISHGQTKLVQRKDLGGFWYEGASLRRVVVVVLWGCVRRKERGVLR
jgi:hypothetical protein